MVDGQFGGRPVGGLALRDARLGEHQTEQQPSAAGVIGPAR